MAASSSNSPVDSSMSSADQGNAPTLDFPSWNELPSEIRTILAEHQQEGLKGEHGLLLYRAASENKRYDLLKGAVANLISSTSTDGKHARIAEALQPYLAHKVQVMVRERNGTKSQAYYLAKEDTQSHRIVTGTVAKQELRAHLAALMLLIEDNFLFEGNLKKARALLQLKDHLKDLDEIPEAEPLMLKLRSIEQALDLHKALQVDKNAIVKCFMESSLTIPLENLNWFPTPDGDVDLTTGLTRQRWLAYNVAGLAITNYKVPRELVQQPLDQWSDEERTTHFGFMGEYFARLSGNDEVLLRQMLASLYILMCGDHDYIVMWLGPTGSGKSTLLKLFCQVMGSLGFFLEDKSALFRTKEKKKKGEHDPRIQDARCVMMDNVTQEDEFNKSAMKRFSHTPILLSGTALPKLPSNEALQRRIRIVEFPAQFIQDEDLTTSLTQESVAEQFLNFIILHGRQAYQQQPLSRQIEPEVKAKAAPSSSPASESRRHETLQAWFERCVQPEPGTSVTLTELGKAYAKDHSHLRQPDQFLYSRLQKELPEIAKSFRTASDTLSVILVGYRLI